MSSSIMGLHRLNLQAGGRKPTSKQVASEDLVETPGSIRALHRLVGPEHMNADFLLVGPLVVRISGPGEGGTLLLVHGEFDCVVLRIM